MRNRDVWVHVESQSLEYRDSSGALRSAYLPGKITVFGENGVQLQQFAWLNDFLRWANSENDLNEMRWMDGFGEMRYSQKWRWEETAWVMTIAEGIEQPINLERHLLGRVMRESGRSLDAVSLPTAMTTQVTNYAVLDYSGEYIGFFQTLGGVINAVNEIAGVDYAYWLSAEGGLSRIDVRFNQA